MIFYSKKQVIFTLVALFFSVKIFATSTLICDATPYLFIVHYSHSQDPIHSFELVKGEKSLLKGNVNKLNSFSLSWPETKQSPKNKLFFSGQLLNRQIFTGKAFADKGNLTVNKESYRFICDWRK